jgi:hypothetical protein
MMQGEGANVSCGNGPSSVRGMSGMSGMSRDVLALAPSLQELTDDYGGIVGPWIEGRGPRNRETEQSNGVGLWGSKDHE